MASVAQMTSTMLDSGCKHIIPVRVSMDTLMNLAQEKDQNVFYRDKMRFCAHKSDLLLCVNRPFFPESTGALARNAAYPHILSTLGDISEECKKAIKKLYHQPELYLESAVGVSQLVADAAPASTETEALKRDLSRLPNFTFMGFSLGLAYAHPSSGDTVVSSMIGGMLTVQNGHFPVCTGDMIMWYFSFEEENFDPQGRRLAEDMTEKRTLDPATKGRETMHQRQNGNIDIGNEHHTGKVNVAYPKPYFPSKHRTGGLDGLRVFAKAVSNARPFDMVDILICTQSI